MEHEPKISTVEAILLVIIFGIADILSLIPIVDWVVLLAIAALFLVYLLPTGKVSLSEVQYLLLGGGIIEGIPGLSALPAYLAVIFRIIYLDRQRTGPAKTAADPNAVSKIKNPKRTLPTAPSPKV